MLDGRDPVAASYDLLRAVRTSDTERAEQELDALAAVGSMELAAALGDDDARVAFWVNVYNGVVQHRLRTAPERYDSKFRFFRRDQVTIAGEGLSLDDIENGILRRSMLGWGLGYLPRPLPSGFELTHRVDELDPRIHFALNCGAASCPPIVAYSRDGVDAELDLATDAYFESEVRYDGDRDVVTVPRLFRWYRGDFGGRAGIIDLLRQYAAIPSGASPSIHYGPYDWGLALDNYLEVDGAEDGAVDDEREAEVA